MTFGFRVQIEPVPPDGDPDTDQDWVNGWTVSLPHQCDRWTVTATGDRELAVQQMEQFVAEATLALARLKELSAPL